MSVSRRSSTSDPVLGNLGPRIREARERKRWSQGELAAKLGKTQATVSSWEAGRRSPGVSDLVALAGELDLDVGELLDVPGGREDPGVRHERRLLLRAEVNDAALDYLLDDIDAFAAAAEALPAPQPRLAVAGKDPVRAAGQVLAAGEAKKPPVRLARLVKLCGVRLLAWPFQRDVSGVMVDLAGEPAIGFNEQHAVTRRRFTIAHELGHYLLRHHDDGLHIDLSEAPSSYGEPPLYDWKQERAANAFAAELLMPETMIRPARRSTKDLGGLAERFEVSREAMGFRLVNLGLR